jgi:hypothetical protein
MGGMAHARSGLLGEEMTNVLAVAVVAVAAVYATVEVVAACGASPACAVGAGAGAGSQTTTRKSAATRANELHSVLDPQAQRRRTTAVTETAEGVRVVSSSRKRLEPAQRAQLASDEVEGKGTGHAEATGIQAAKSMGLTPTGTAASRPICPSCAETMKNENTEPLSPLKK